MRVHLTTNVFHIKHTTIPYLIINEGIVKTTLRLTCCSQMYNHCGYKEYVHCNWNIFSHIILPHKFWIIFEKYENHTIWCKFEFGQKINAEMNKKSCPIPLNSLGRSTICSEYSNQSNMIEQSQYSILNQPIIY